MRCLFLERFIFNPLDNWLFDFETQWYSKPTWKKITMFPLIFFFGEVSNIKRQELSRG